MTYIHDDIVSDVYFSVTLQALTFGQELMGKCLASARFLHLYLDVNYFTQYGYMAIGIFI